MFDKTNELYYYKYNKNRITSQGAYAQMEVKTMLTDMGTILRQAKKEGYGVAAPNAWSLNTVKSIFEAASELKAPRSSLMVLEFIRLKKYQMPFIFMKRNFQK